MKKQYDFTTAKRGPVLPAPPGKTRITIRIDDDILDWFRAHAEAAGGASYQTMINAALRRAMNAKAESVESTNTLLKTPDVGWHVPVYYGVRKMEIEALLARGAEHGDSCSGTRGEWLRCRIAVSAVEDLFHLFGA